YGGLPFGARPSGPCRLERRFKLQPQLPGQWVPTATIADVLVLGAAGSGSCRPVCKTRGPGSISGVASTKINSLRPHSQEVLRSGVAPGVTRQNARRRGASESVRPFFPLAAPDRLIPRIPS